MFTRRLCARFIKEATEALGVDQHRNELSHATGLELASIEMWIHEESSHAANNLDLRGVIVKVRGVQHSDGVEKEPKEGNINIQQQPSAGAAEQSTNDTDASGNKPQVEETIPSKLEYEMIGNNKDKKPNKKGNGGTIPKTTKMPSNSNLRPKLPERGP